MKKKTLLTTIAIFTIAFSISAQEKGIFKDSRDGKTYKTVKIGTQTWMAENLAYKAGSGCWAYNDSDSNIAQYGYLYDWKTAKTVCPAGWHLPTMEEYKALLANFGGEGEVAYKALIAGGSSGFSAQFCGCRRYNGEFISMGSDSYFWSSTVGRMVAYTDCAWAMNLTSNYKGASLDSQYYQSGGFSVRCVKD